MSESKLARGPLYGAVASVLLGAGAYALPTFMPDFPYAEQATLVMFAFAGLTVLLLILAVVLGRRGAAAAVDPSGLAFAAATTSEASAAIDLDGMSKEDRKAYEKAEKRRQAEEAKFRKQAEKDAAKAEKQAAKAAKKGKAVSQVDLLEEETTEWINAIREAQLDDEDETKSPSTVYDLDDTTLDPYTMPTSAFVAPQPVAVDYAADYLSPAVQEPVPTQPSALDAPMFDEEVLDPAWLAAAYEDPNFTAPYADESTPQPVAHDERTAFAEEEAPAMDDPIDVIADDNDVQPHTPVYDETVVFTDVTPDLGEAPVGEPLVYGYEGPHEHHEPAQEEHHDGEHHDGEHHDGEHHDGEPTWQQPAVEPAAVTAERLAAQMAALVGQAEAERAAAAEKAQWAEGRVTDLERQVHDLRAQMESEVEAARAAAASQEEIEAARTAAASARADAERALAEATRLARTLEEVESNLNDMIEAQHTVVEAAASAERVRLAVRVRAMRAQLAARGVGEDVLSIIDSIPNA